MSGQLVSLKRAKGSPTVVLWDGRRAEAGDNAKPLIMSLQDAATLVERDPDEWTVEGDKGKTVAAEIKRRADERAKAEAEAAKGKG